MGEYINNDQTGEEKNSEQLMQLRRRHQYVGPQENLYLVTFSVDEVLPLLYK